MDLALFALESFKSSHFTPEQLEKVCWARPGEAQLKASLLGVLVVHTVESWPETKVTL